MWLPGQRLLTMPPLLPALMAAPLPSSSGRWLRCTTASVGLEAELAGASADGGAWRERTEQQSVWLCHQVRVADN